MGAPAYYPLIESGRNWYESNAYVELILDGTKELVFIVDTMGRGKKRKRIANGIAGAAGETRADNETWCESAVYFTG